MDNAVFTICCDDPTAALFRVVYTSSNRCVDWNGNLVSMEDIDHTCFHYPSDIGNAISRFYRKRKNNA